MNIRQAVTRFLLSVCLTSTVFAQDGTHPPVIVKSVPAPRAEPSDSGDVPLGLPTAWASPKYPKQALRNRIQGSVSLRVSVDNNGRVTDVSASGGDPELAEAAVEAVRKWKFAPHSQAGNPFGVHSTLTIDLKIDDAGHPKVTYFYTLPDLPGAGPVFGVGPGISAPKAIKAPDPEYSEEARRARYQGRCVLNLIVGSDGLPHNIRIWRPLGMGLDESAMQAVRQWRFQPAMKDGVPVAVAINVEVQFRLSH